MSFRPFGCPSRAGRSRRGGCRLAGAGGAGLFAFPARSGLAGGAPVRVGSGGARGVGRSAACGGRGVRRRMRGVAGRTPRLLLPAELWRGLNETQRDTLLLHELAHLRRRDHLVRWLELLVVGLYWWHPAAWWAIASLRQAEE